MKVGKTLIDIPHVSFHHLENFLPAYIIAKSMRMTLSDIQEGAYKLKPFTHRFERVALKSTTLIDDTYNAKSFML